MPVYLDLPIRDRLGSATCTSPYGPRIHPVTRAQSFHRGIDLRGGTGTPVRSPISGSVVAMLLDGQGAGVTAGNTLYIEGEDPTGRAGRIRVVFMHLHAFADDLVVGDVLPDVREGQIVGYVGATGRVTGPHLHYGLQVREGSPGPGSHPWAYVDPIAWHKPGSVTLRNGAHVAPFDGNRRVA